MTARDAISLSWDGGLDLAPDARGPVNRAGLTYQEWRKVAGPEPESLDARRDQRWAWAQGVDPTVASQAVRP